jgi:hypothetical protein
MIESEFNNPDEFELQVAFVQIKSDKILVPNDPIQILRLLRLLVQMSQVKSQRRSKSHASQSKTAQGDTTSDILWRISNRKEISPINIAQVAQHIDQRIGNSSLRPSSRDGGPDPSFEDIEGRKGARAHDKHACVSDGGSMGADHHAVSHNRQSKRPHYQCSSQASSLSNEGVAQ